MSTLYLLKVWRQGFTTPDYYIYDEADTARREFESWDQLDQDFVPAVTRVRLTKFEETDIKRYKILEDTDPEEVNS